MLDGLHRLDGLCGLHRRHRLRGRHRWHSRYRRWIGVDRIRRLYVSCHSSSQTIKPSRLSHEVVDRLNRHHGLIGGILGNARHERSGYLVRCTAVVAVGIPVIRVARILVNELLILATWGRIADILWCLFQHLRTGGKSIC